MRARYLHSYTVRLSGTWYSFGTAVQVLPIPELMPFRLTRQMTGALQPHDALALFQAPCTLVMSALRLGKAILENLMTIFRQRHCPLSMQLQALHDILRWTPMPPASSYLLVIESMSTSRCCQDAGPLNVSGTPAGHHGCVHAGAPT
ncbi:hypothetical protein ABBQ38_007698 [Trebouxia sp. C0009 RCD-2024]